MRTRPGDQDRPAGTAKARSASPGTAKAAMYHDAASWRGRWSAADMAPGGGTEIPVTVWSSSGRLPASAQATREPQSCPTTCARGRPVSASAASTNATASATSSVVR